MANAARVKYPAALQRCKLDTPLLAAGSLIVHGNHEERASEIGTYKERIWHGGVVYYEEEFPDILFARDGEIYDFKGKRGIIIGGAYSVDKDYRLSVGLPWFESEQPSAEIKAYVEEQLNKCDWTVDFVLSHTCPLSLEPRDLFLDFIDQGRVDKSTEEWLERIRFFGWAGAPVRDITDWYPSDTYRAYGVLTGDTESWQKYLQNIEERKLYVDFSDIQVVVYFLSEQGIWMHEHVNPMLIAFSNFCSQHRLFRKELPALQCRAFSHRKMTKIRHFSWNEVPWDFESRQSCDMKG